MNLRRTTARRYDCTCKQALRFQEEGRELELSSEHHTALALWDDAYIDVLTDSTVRFTISEVDQFLGCIVTR